MKAEEGKEKQNKEREDSADPRKKKAFRGRKLFFLFYLFIVTSLFTAGTLSKYMTTLTGTGTAAVAKPICEIFFPDQMQGKITGGKLMEGVQDVYIGVRNYTPGASEGEANISEVAMSYRITVSRAGGAEIGSDEYQIYEISKDESGNDVQTPSSSNEMAGTLEIAGKQEKIYLIKFTSNTAQSGETQLEFKLVSEQILG